LRFALQSGGLHCVSFETQPVELVFALVENWPRLDFPKNAA
jgi:hypothetical protein